MNELEKQRIFVERTQRKYPRVWEGYLELIQHELMSKDELAELNFKKRKAIVRYAYDHTVFYRRLYDSIGFNPRDLKSEDDWNALPVVTKEMVRENFEEMIADQGVRKYGVISNTGGSTGVPLRVLRDSRFELPNVVWRFRGWWAQRKYGIPYDEVPVLGQNEARIFRMSGGGGIKSATQLKRDVDEYWPQERFYLDARKMDADAVERFVSAISSSGVTFLHGYAGAVADLSRQCLSRKINFKIPYVSVISSPISELEICQITDAFKGGCFNVYGCQECFNIAASTGCDGQSLHVNSDLRQVDILDNNGASCVCGERGVVHITSFTNYVMPFVRYRLGDVTRYLKEVCSCGLPFPMIDKINGRESDFIQDKFSQNVYGLNAVFDSNPLAVDSFQFCQSRRGECVLRVVKNSSYCDAQKEIDTVFQDLEIQFSGRIDFKLEYVKEIRHDDGKIRFIVHE